MKILVTGAAGFLGSHLVDQLLAEGHHVIGMDNFLTGRKENIAHLDHHSDFLFIEHDITHPYHDQISHVDQIYNLACPASPPQFQRNPVKTVVTCTVGVIHGLEAAKKFGARFFQASTSEIYGDPDIHPQPETYRGNVNTTGPRACYDEGKRVSESLCVAYRDQEDVDSRIVRIFNTYGPRMDPGDGRVISNFVVQALKGQPLTIYGSGEQTRSFCYVDDTIRGLIALMNTPTDPGPVNIGNPDEYSIREIAEEIGRLVGIPIKIDSQPLPVDDPRRRKPDITKAQTILSWHPSVSLQGGLKKTIDYFREQI